jgi:hypothetical protein
LGQEATAVEPEFIEETDKDHGRLEIRCYWIPDEVLQSKRLKSINMVKREYWAGDKKMIEKHFYINSIAADARC